MKIELEEEKKKKKISSVYTSSDWPGRIRFIKCSESAD
jgi:hypothetical protein